MKETLRDRFSREMTVRGLSQRTQDSYLLNVTLLVKRTGKHPTKLFTADLRNYFAWMVNVHAVESSTYRQHLAAVRESEKINCPIVLPSTGIQIDIL